MSLSRRDLFKGMGAIAATRAGAHQAQSRRAAPPLSQVTQDTHTPHWGMVIDLRRCVGCQACSVACGLENGVPVGHFRTFASVYEMEINGSTRRAVLPRTCNHCENPPCVQVCPTQATTRTETGAVVVDNTVCIGCGYCVQTCPYEARYIHPETHTADKCTFCLHRLEAGLLPACVETCVGGARIFGDMNDANSQVSQLRHSHGVQILKPELGTGPSVVYIGLSEALKHKIDGVREGPPREGAQHG